jgi:enoyl-CoA hydratase/carnithine racemase
VPVEIQSSAGAGVITLSRQESLNAWDMAMQRDVQQALLNLTEDRGTEFIVVTGAGDKAFCAGQDLKESAEFTPDQVDGWLRSFADLYDAALSSPKPVIAALNGIAAGSGYQFAMTCDLRIAHPGVRIGQPEVSSGIPSITGLYLTWQSLGHSRTTELMLSGRLLDAREAHQIGLIHALVPAEALMDEAIAAGRRLAAQPRLAFAQTKRRIRDCLWSGGLADAFEAARAIDAEAWSSGEPRAVAQRFFDAHPAGGIAAGCS